MIGLLLVTHGRLADEFLAALEHVVGPQTQIEAISIGADDDMGHRRQDIVDAVGRVADGKGAVTWTSPRSSMLHRRRGGSTSVLRPRC
jgi:mannose PTS system EIIA component